MNNGGILSIFILFNNPERILIVIPAEAGIQLV